MDRAKTSALRMSPKQIERQKKKRKEKRKVNRATNAAMARESVKRYNNIGIENIEGYSPDILMKIESSPSRVESPCRAESRASQRSRDNRLATPKSNASRRSQNNKQSSQNKFGIETVRFNEDISAIRVKT